MKFSLNWEQWRDITVTYRTKLLVFDKLPTTLCVQRIFAPTVDWGSLESQDIVVLETIRNSKSLRRQSPISPFKWLRFYYQSMDLVKWHRYVSSDGHFSDMELTCGQPIQVLSLVVFFLNGLGTERIGTERNRNGWTVLRPIVRPFKYRS